MLKVLTYNIHKGFDRRNRDFVLHEIREHLHLADVDIVFLQEIQGRHYHHENRVSGWPGVSQFEFLADSLWPHYAYGKNAIYDEGHHGNAILSKHPFVSWENVNLSRFRRASRSLLHGVINLEDSNRRLHLICVHLELVGFERKRQLKILQSFIKEAVADGEPVILAGDFNDWNGLMGTHLESSLTMQEAFRATHGKYARTFPSNWPVLKMDRIYFNDLNLLDCKCLKGPPWQQLSDHLPLYAQFEF